MSNLRSGSFISSVTLFLVIVVMFSSCHKNKDVNPDYAGTWAAEQAILTSGAVLQVKDVVTLTKDSYSDLIQVFYQSANKYIDYLEMSGNLSVSESVMNVELNEIGITTFDVTGKPTGTLQKYKEGTPAFDTLFAQTGQSKTFSFEYAVSGNSLTIYSDNNNDGNYTDPNETTVYTRQ